jgi:hypothetical protein
MSRVILNLLKMELRTDSNREPSSRLLSQWHCGLVLGRYSIRGFNQGRDNGYSDEVLWGAFLQFLETNAHILPRLGYNCFLSKPLQFVSSLFPSHLAIQRCSLSQ